jgi:uncharacterized protein (UPF0333 family)
MNPLNDEHGQISAEMVLLLGAIMVIVIIAGVYVFGISKSVSGNVTEVTNSARSSAINRM